MWSWLKRKKKPEQDAVSVWKDDFSDCIAADYLPTYSVCQTEKNTNCRFLVRYSGMKLCGHKRHKDFIPADAEPFDPLRGQFS